MKQTHMMIYVSHLLKQCLECGAQRVLDIHRTLDVSCDGEYLETLLTVQTTVGPLRGKTP